MKSTPKKRKVLRHGATSFTGNKRRSHRDLPRRPRPAPAEVPSGETSSDEPRDDQRLQKILAAAGIGSRRECEELILAGRIEVDGQPVTTLGVRVDSRKQKITLDGEPVKFQRRSYYAVNKPTGVLSTNSDPSGRIRVVDLIGGEQRLFTVGRLDQHSEGLIIVTNDGEMTQRLTHPKYGVPKVYNVQVAGEAGDEVVDKLLAGVRLEEGIAKAARAVIRKQSKSFSILEMVLTEGRNREIRRMLAQLGHKVQRLTRIAVGPVRLNKLKPGQFRLLELHEVKALKDLAFKRGAEVAQDAPRESRPPRNKFKPRREGAGDTGPASKEFRPPRGGAKPFGKRSGKPMGRPEGRPTGKPFGKSAGRPAKSFRDAEGQPSGDRPKPRKFATQGAAESAGTDRPPRFERPKGGRPASGRPVGDRARGGRVGGSRTSGGRPGGDRHFGDRARSDRPKRAEKSQGAPPARKFDRPAKKPHPLPFLKQGTVLDENDMPVPATTGRPPMGQPPRASEPGRKKPLRRLRVRRGKS